MKNAIIYCRKSTTWDDRQALSLESQLDFCQKKAKEGGLNVVEIIQESMSAKDPWRPGFAKMMALIEKWKADHIVCWKLNRLARNLIDGGTISYSLSQWLIKNIYTDSWDFTPETNTLLLSVHFGMSSQFSIELKKDIMRGMRTSIEKWNVIQKLPRGYKRDKNTAIVEPTDKAYLIKEAFEFWRRWKHEYFPNKMKITSPDPRAFLLAHRDHSFQISFCSLARSQSISCGVLREALPAHDCFVA